MWEQAFCEKSCNSPDNLSKSVLIKVLCGGIKGHGEDFPKPDIFNEDQIFSATAMFFCTKSGMKKCNLSRLKLSQFDKKCPAWDNTIE
jgi:hypothetical protein